MNETMISITGNVATDLRFVRSERGTPLASFRLASTERRYDRGRGEWTDGRTTFVTVVCWRSLAENAAASLRKGDPVVVLGRLRVEPWEREDGRTGTSVEVVAHAIGHDLSRGTSAFRRTRREPGDAISDGQIEQLAGGEVEVRQPTDSSSAGSPADGSPRARVSGATEPAPLVAPAATGEGVGVTDAPEVDVDSRAA
ncbi:single-stranded DNA-binding protein [Thermasporomyces composti]|uniref:Single-stranded DNA-binding protein n=1 Tax=Thermasporomyces composti TaxID=696763 RepID=A0A3D9V7I0_THECX|nr:single-stranded DNA-binding protein [Thermasporomyces composti]REF37742.1 single-strand DNA-binding protein [Thermasporomyces composti]